MAPRAYHAVTAIQLANSPQEKNVRGPLMQDKKHASPARDCAWILTNGTVGMLAQGLAVAKAVGVPFELKTVRVRGPLAWLPSRMQIWLPPGVLLRFVASSEPLHPPWPRLIVSVGHQSVAPAVALKRLSNHSTFAVHVQDPKVSAHHFDWIAAPKHDGLTGPNVTTTLGSVHGVNPVRVAEAKEPFASLIGWLPRPRITVLLGGSSRALAPDAEELWTVASHDGAREQWIPSCYTLRPHLACGSCRLIAGDFRHPEFRLEWHRRKSLPRLVRFRRRHRGHWRLGEHGYGSSRYRQTCLCSSPAGKFPSHRAVSCLHA
jgi:hypothetical protein